MDYVDEEDVFLQLLRECTEEGEADDKIPMAALYKEIMKHAYKSDRMKQMTRKSMGKHLRDRGYRVKKGSRNITYVNGLRLVQREVRIPAY